MNTLTKILAISTGSLLTVALLMGITGHSLSLADLNQKIAPVTSEPVLTTATTGTRQLVVGETITDAGTVALGKISQIQMEDGTRMQVFGTADNAAPQGSAGFVVTSGTVWVSNPVLGSPISLSADRVFVRQTTGGLMVQQKFDPVSHTIIGNGYGIARVQILAADRKTVLVESTLPPAAVLSVDADFLSTLESADTPEARTAAFTAAIQGITGSSAQSSVHTYMQGDVWRVSHALADLQALLANSDNTSSDILTTLRSNLAITPVAQKLLSARVLMSSLAGLTQQPITSLPGGAESAQDVLATIEPYTRLIPFAPLLGNQQQLIATLAKSQKVLDKALNKQISPDEVLRPLLAALADPKQIAELIKASATTVPADIQPEYTALLTAVMAQADPVAQTSLKARMTALTSGGSAVAPDAIAPVVAAPSESASSVTTPISAPAPVAASDMPAPAAVQNAVLNNTPAPSAATPASPAAPVSNTTSGDATQSASTHNQQLDTSNQQPATSTPHRVRRSDAAVQQAETQLGAGQ